MMAALAVTADAPRQLTAHKEIPMSLDTPVGRAPEPKLAPLLVG
jgi:hypothetical protein